MYKLMKIKFKKILKEQGGQILPLVLVMLVLGSTIVASSLTYAATTIQVGHESLDREEQYYGAEAGAKDAIWRFKHDGQNTIDQIGATEWIYQPSPVNDQDIEVTASYVAGVKNVWKVVSEAHKYGFSTTVEYFLSGVSVFFSNTAVAAGTINTYNKDIEDILFPPKYKENYPNFPTPADLRDFYTDRNPPLEHRAVAAIDTNSNPTIPATGVYYENSIQIKGNGTLTLDGNIFIDGNLDFTNTTWTINLNGHTIYATGTMLQAKKQGYFDGPGCIIAEGDITLFPQSHGGYEDKYIFVMSVSGSAQLKPNSSFYGSVAGGSGDVSLELQSGCKVIHTTLPLGGLDFPDDPNTFEWSVSNWKIAREPILFVVTKVLAPGEVNIPYSENIIAKNGVQPYTGWEIIDGALPDGLSLSLDAGMCVISGNPTTAAASPSYSTFTIQVTDSDGTTGTQTLTIAVYPHVTIPAQILTEGKVGEEYSYELSVTGGLEPYIWSLDSESFPALSDWVNLDDLSKGIISGTPTVDGTYSFSISVVDLLGVSYGPVIVELTITN
jgi:hypothetical protein